MSTIDLSFCFAPSCGTFPIKSYETKKVHGKCPVTLPENRP